MPNTPAPTATQRTTESLWKALYEAGTAATTPHEPAPTAVERTAEVLWEAIDDKGIRGRLYREDCDYLAAVLTAEGIVPSAVMSTHWCNPSCESGCTIGETPEPVSPEATAGSDEPAGALTAGGGNRVLGDALAYFAQRRTMTNPKGWAHVLRITEGAVAAGLYDANLPETTEALTVLRHLVETETSAQEAITSLRAFVAASNARSTPTVPPSSEH